MSFRREEINFINIHTKEREDNFQKAIKNYEKAIKSETEVVDNNNDYFDKRNDLFLDEIEQAYKKFSIRNTNLAQTCKKLYDEKIKLCKYLLRKDDNMIQPYKKKIQTKVNAIENKLENQRLGVGKKDAAKEYQIRRQRYEGLKEMNQIEEKAFQFEQQIFNEFKYIPEISKYTKYSGQQDINSNQNNFLEYVDNQSKPRPFLQIEDFMQQQQWQIPQMALNEQENELLNQFQRKPEALQLPPQVQFIQQSAFNQMQPQQQQFPSPYNENISPGLQLLQDKRFLRDLNNKIETNAIQSEMGTEQGISFQPYISSNKMQNKNEFK